MIRIRFNPDALSPEQKVFFTKWLNVARIAKEKFDGETFRAKVWTQLKAWLLDNFFHGKCAYCEVNITAGFVGDAEHYRPKGAVEEIVNGRLVPVSDSGRAHPGYYWLAYDWENLIPACTNCNTINGKRTRFPIMGRRVFDPTVGPDTRTLNVLEMPLLLHPYDTSRDPSDHLVFTPDGHVVGLDEIGVQTIKLLDLDREALVTLRQQILSDMRGRLGQSVGSVIADENLSEVANAMDRVQARLTQPELMFSAARRDLIVAIRAQMSPRQVSATTGV
jgi:hypothetical protein